MFFNEIYIQGKLIIDCLGIRATRLAKFKMPLLLCQINFTFQQSTD